MHKTVVAVDPGGTTGICLWSPEVGPSLMEMVPNEAVEFLAECAAKIQPLYVIEKYTITAATAKMTQQHDALEIIGALKYIALKHRHPLVLQTPAEAKKFSTNEKLKRIGWYKPGLPHARDASRHALLFAAKNGLINLEDLL